MKFYWESGKDEILARTLKAFNVKGLMTFDDEETTAVNNEWKSTYETSTLKDRYFSDDFIKGLQEGCAGIALLRLARIRFEQGKLEEAILSCLKSLSLAKQNHEAWLFFAELLINHYGKGGYRSTMAYVEKAKDAYKALQASGNFHPDITIGDMKFEYKKIWEDKVQRVIGIINETVNG